MPNQFLSPEGDLENYFITEYWLIDQYVGDTLWTWGRGSFGLLGNNATVTRSTPVTTFAGGANWQQVDAGNGYASAAIKTDGTLWVWGGAHITNSGGVLGVPGTGARQTPITTFAGGTNWKQVSVAYGNMGAVKTDGTLWVWGINSNNQLASNALGGRTTPVTTFAGGTNWKQVSVSNGFVGAVKTDGTLWVWGNSVFGILGTNDATPQRSTPVTTFAGGTNWKQVSVGLQHVAAIKTDGTLWTWGNNAYGQLGDSTSTSRSTPVTTFAGGNNWKQVSSGFNSISAIKNDGTLWIWGRNNSGQIGNNVLSSNRSTPVTTFAGGTNWKQVSCGGEHVAAIKTDGTLWLWGRNSTSPYIGLLGINDLVNRSTPVTTFAGGTNWKQASGGGWSSAAVTSGTDPRITQ